MHHFAHSADSAPAPDSAAPASALLDWAVSQIARLYLVLPIVTLQPGEKAAFGGQLFRRAPELALLVATALSEHPELFPDVPFTGAELLEEQRCASAWSALSRLHRGSTAFSDDSYIAAQSSVIRKIRSVLAAVGQGTEAPQLSPGLDHKARVLAMAGSLRVLGEVYQERTDNRAKPQAPKAPPAGGAVLIKKVKKLKQAAGQRVSLVRLRIRSEMDALWRGVMTIVIRT